MKHLHLLPVCFLLAALSMAEGAAFTYQRAEKTRGINFDSDSSKMKPGEPVEPMPRMNFEANPLLSWIRPKTRVVYQPKRHPENGHIISDGTIHAHESSHLNKSHLHPSSSSAFEVDSSTEPREEERQMIDETNNNSSASTPIQDASYLHEHYEHEHDHYHPPRVYHDDDSETHEEIYPSHEEPHPYHPSHYELTEPVVLLEHVEPHYVLVKEKHIHHLPY